MATRAAKEAVQEKVDEPVQVDDIVPVAEVSTRGLDSASLCVKTQAVLENLVHLNVLTIILLRRTCPSKILKKLSTPPLMRNVLRKTV